MEFIYYAPLRIVFGKHSISKIASFTARNGNRVLLVTGKNHLKETGVLNYILDLFHNNKKIEEIILFDKAEENPDTQLINQAKDAIIDNNLNVVVAVGGGSTMDLAKAASICAKQNKTIEEIMDSNDINILKAYPIICSPTTSGSGSEVTKYSVINDLNGKTKRAIGSENIYPTVSILDPTLTYTMNRQTIANTGFDALSHAIEAYTSKSSSPITDAYCRQAISLIGENLEKAYNNKDQQAMDNMSLAAMLAGMALNVGRASLPHAMEHSLSAYKKNLAHGLGLSVIMNGFIKRAADCNKERFADIAYLLGENISNMTLEDSSLKTIDAVERIKNAINLNKNLSELGFNKHILEEMVENTFWTMAHGIDNSPCPFTKKEILDIYLEAL